MRFVLDPSRACGCWFRLCHKSRLCFVLRGSIPDRRERRAPYV